MKKYFLSLLIAISIFTFSTSYALEANNSGFINEQIWYSKDVLKEGDMVDIHTAVWNGELNSLSVKVEFFDKSVILGTREVVIKPSELKDIFISWKVTAGDHLISAKITSSSATISGKTEKVVIDRNTTKSDKQSISVLVKDSSGEPISVTNKIQTQLEDTGSKINDILPEQVNESISSGLDAVEVFREDKFIEAKEIKEQTKAELDLIKEQDVDDNTISKNINVGVEDAIEKPITYIKLFLFTALVFILGSKIIFYGLLILIIVYILRTIYRKIRNK